MGKLKHRYVISVYVDENEYEFVEEASKKNNTNMSSHMASYLQDDMKKKSKLKVESKEYR